MIAIPTAVDLVDPELRPLLDLLPPLNFEAQSLADIRNLAMPQSPNPANDVTLTRALAPGPCGAPDVPLHIYLPSNPSDALPCILHIHGGGFVMGNPANQEAAHRSLAGAMTCAIVSVDYRLAPETPHPGAIDDCYAALGWVFENAAQLGIDRTRIGVMGESAGGGLAAALALMAHDRGAYRLAFQHLIYPMLDDRTCVGDPDPFAGTFVWTPASNWFGWTSLLGHEPGVDHVSPYAAPARAQNLCGLPPTFMATGALDLFRDEDMDYARRLMRVGVPVELHVYPGAFHGFDLMPSAGVAKAMRKDSTMALRRVLRARTAPV